LDFAPAFYSGVINAEENQVLQYSLKQVVGIALRSLRWEALRINRSAGLYLMSSGAQARIGDLLDYAPAFYSGIINSAKLQAFQILPEECGITT
jgi:hypothetical protein